MLCDNVFVIFYYISVEYNTYSIVDDVEQIFSFCPKSNIEKIFGMKGVLYYGYDSFFSWHFFRLPFDPFFHTQIVFYIWDIVPSFLS